MESIDEIFANARAIRDPSARLAYLDLSCGKSTALRARVAALLGDADGADAYFGPEPGPDAVRSPFEQPGMTIGRYRLLEKLGEGGMGVVFMAEQREPVSRRVALKIIKAGMDTRQVVARFEAERQALAMMDHPNIAKVLDGGATEHGRPYFVMDLVQGSPITQFCDDARLTTRQRLEVFLDVCAAIQHAHQKGIIHRDIKPSNILVALHGNKPVPKVIDFGIAKATHEPLTDKTLLTHFQQCIGTPAYMSPEQAGLSLSLSPSLDAVAATATFDIDTRSDVYSLGVLLYELLIGRTPFDGGELVKGGLDAMRGTIRETEPTCPSTRLRSLSASDRANTSTRRNTEPLKLVQLVRGDLDWIAMKCLEKDRTRRYQTANALAADLQRHLANEPVVARPPTALYRLQKTARRNKTLFIAVSAVVAALIAGLAVSTSLLLRARQAEREQFSLREKAERAEQAKTEELARSYLAQAQAVRQTLQADRRERSLDAIRRVIGTGSAASLELRKEAIAALALPALGPPRTWRDFPGTTEWPKGHLTVTDADVRRYATVTPEQDITIRQIVDQRELWRLPKAGRGLSAMVWSQDGSVLALRNSDGAVRIWNMSNGQQVWKQSLSAELAGSLDVSPDGRWLAAGDRQRNQSQTQGYEIRFYALAEQAHQEPGSTNRHPTLVRSMVVPFAPQGIKFDPSGRRLLVRDAAQWQVWDLKLNRIVRTQVHPSQNFTGLAWHPDGRTIGGGGDNGEVFLWDIESGQQRILRGHESVVTSVFFHTRGDLICSRSWDGTTRLSDVHTGQAVLATELGFAMSFSADGKRLSLYKDSAELGVWPVSSSRVFRSLVGVPGGEPDASQLAFSPDGTVIVWQDAEGFRWLDLATGEIQQRRCPGVKWLFFDPDGESLLTAGQELRRWPVRRSSTGSRTRVEIGTPGLLATAAPGGYDYATVSATGSLFVSDRNGWTVDPGMDRARTFRRTGRGELFRASLSPDRRWTVLGQWHGGVFLTETESGRMTREWPLERNAMVGFTPDGHWLVTGTGAAYRFWNTSTWQQGKVFPRQLATGANGLMAFSSDSRLMAIARTGSLVQLVDLQAGDVLADLTPPTPQALAALVLSPDGGFLASSGRQGIHLWDLRALRAELATLGLDWNLPPLSASPISLAHSTFHAASDTRLTIPQRPADAPPQSIDLTDHYAVPLNETWQNMRNSLVDLPSGRHVFGGIAYDIRGSIHLRCPAIPRFPAAVHGIRVHQRFRRMHLLGGIGFESRSGETIATNRLHYADGSTVDMPIIAGKDLANWWYRPDESTHGLDVVWTGTNAQASEGGYRIRLLHGVWTNPKPDIAVERIDILNAGSQASPFIVAMTVE